MNHNGSQNTGQNEAHRSSGTYSFPGQAPQNTTPYGNQYSTNHTSTTYASQQNMYTTGPDQNTGPQRGYTKNDEFGLRDDERGEQFERMEVLQSNPSQSDTDQSRLRDEFPDIDGSLIAALYSDTGSYSGTKEMIQAMNE